jgi:5-(carboxyamino)imidazole ribonucleotide mutase
MNQDIRGRSNTLESPVIAVIMGSVSDWDTMRHADATLRQFSVAYECQVVSAHRTPDRMRDYARGAAGRGLEVIIAAAGGAAHLPGMVAAHTSLPVLGVPVRSAALQGIDSLLSIVQMPAGVPVGTLAIGRAGAVNAALLAVAVAALHRPPLRAELEAFRRRQTEAVLGASLPPADSP